MSEDTVIEASGLTKTYGKAVAVDHVSFTVGRFSVSSAPTAPARPPPS
jgi:ABC-type branched-subunit amino acid transport system ATPase component